MTQAGGSPREVEEMDLCLCWQVGEGRECPSLQQPHRVPTAAG